MKKKQATKRTKTSKSAIKDLSPQHADQVKAGKMNAQLSSRSVNPIVVSRDRALNG